MRGCESQVCQCRREGSRPPAVECTNEGIAASCGHCTSCQVNLQHRACKLGLKKLPLQSLRRWNPGHDEARCRREMANEGQPQTTLVLQEGKHMVKAPPRKGEHKVNVLPQGRRRHQRVRAWSICRCKGGALPVMGAASAMAKFRLLGRPIAGVVCGHQSRRRRNAGLSASEQGRRWCVG